MHSGAAAGGMQTAFAKLTADRFDILMTPLIRLFGLSMLVALCSLRAQAGQAPNADASSAKLDAIIETLKKEAVDFNREAQDIEQVVMYPDHSRLSLYVSCQVSRLLLQNVTVIIDDGSPVRYDYSERSAKALLLSDGLHRVLLANVAPGSHRVRAEFRGQFADADAGDAPVVGRFEETFDKTTKPLDLELRVARYTRLSPPKLSLTVWKPASAADADTEEKKSGPKSKGRKRRTPHT